MDLTWERPVAGDDEALEFDCSGERINSRITVKPTADQEPYFSVYRVTPDLRVEVARHG